MRACTKISDDSPYAVKEVIYMNEEVKDYQQNARREYEILQLLQPHSGIVEAFNFYEGKDKSQIVMERLTGCTIAEFREAKMSLSEEIVISMIRQLVQATEHMHMHKVVHRDLNPRNVFMQLEGRDMSKVTCQTRVKIIDFNVSRMKKSLDETDIEAAIESSPILNSFESSILKSDLLFPNRSNKIGTPIYRAPELCSMKASHYTQAIDLWGLGCIVYSLLVGKDAFTEGKQLSLDIRNGFFDKECT